MPGLITKRRKKRWRASIMVGGELRQKIYLDATRKSYRDAVAWETEQKEKLEKTPKPGKTPKPEKTPRPGKTPKP